MSNTPATTAHRTILYILTFIMGGCGIAYEYTFSKLSSDLLGNSAMQWAIIIGLMMLCMGIGSDIQKRIRDEGLFAKFIYFESVLGVLGGFGPLLLLYAFGAFRNHYTVVQYGLTIIVGLLIGLEIPVLTRINEKYTPELKANLGGILRMDYIGAFAGALGWVFVLPVFFSLTQMGFVLGLCNNLAAAIAFVYFRKVVRASASVIAILAVSIAGLGIGLLKAPAWSAHAEQQLYLDKIVYSATTKFQHIVLTQSRAGEIYCFLNGNLQFSSFDEHRYHELLVHPAMHCAPRIEHVLVLGGGDGLAVREILKYPGVQRVTLVDIDPEMTRLARENEYFLKLNQGSLTDSRVTTFQAAGISAGETRPVETRDRVRAMEPAREATAQVSIVNIDAAKFVEHISGRYDVIIIDFPDPNSRELTKLYSKMFYHNLTDKLTKGGILIQQASSPVIANKAFLCVGATMRAAGLVVVPIRGFVPTFGEWGWWIGGRGEAWDETLLSNRLRHIDTLRVSTRYLTSNLIDASLVFGKNALADSAIEVNTIMNDVIYTYYRKALTRGY
ncbi:MAG: polyamine aminopropyltransferase [Chitinivibrionales bacterium]|nr:polyamine aminopropyltransferase [Chitinivibrionales bacterium]